jgi:hypothetical protein
MSSIKVAIPMRRLLSRSDAATYVNLPPKLFAAVCPVRPVALAEGREAFDVRDLDAWVDGAKAGEQADLDALVARLK